MGQVHRVPQVMLPGPEVRAGPGMLDLAVVHIPAGFVRNDHYETGH